MGYWAIIELFLTENAVLFGSGAAVVAIFGGAWVFLKLLVPQKETLPKVELVQPDDNPRLDIVSFLQIQKKMRADIKADLEGAHADERDTLLAKIAELDARIANPDQALQTANERIESLETLLERTGNDIGGDRLAKARTALEAGDYSIADDIFAEVEARADPEVQSAARAAFGRGEIAEAEIRWADAASHYSKAARLDPTYDTLKKAGTFLMRVMQVTQAIKVNLELVELAQRVYGDTHENTATAMNNLALSYNSSDDYAAAETLYRQVLEIDEKTIGSHHSGYALHLCNLAGLFKDKGEYDAAEPMFRQALQITGEALGPDRPEYATRLSNLALLLHDKGEYDDAEPMFRQALQITGKAFGPNHPAYATCLNNLALLLSKKGEYEAAEPMFRQALLIGEKTLGPDHPNYAIDLHNLAVLLQAKGDYAAAEPLYRQVLEIDAKTLGPDHHSYANHMNSLSFLLYTKGDFAAAEPLLLQAISIMEAALGTQHPKSINLRANLEIFLRDKP